MKTGVQSLLYRSIMLIICLFAVSCATLQPADSYQASAQLSEDIRQMAHRIAKRSIHNISLCEVSNAVVSAFHEQLNHYEVGPAEIKEVTRNGGGSIPLKQIICALQMKKHLEKYIKYQPIDIAEDNAQKIFIYFESVFQEFVYYEPRDADLLIEKGTTEESGFSGLTLLKEPGYAKVIDVWPSSPAEESGIKEGDIILDPEKAFSEQYYSGSPTFFPSGEAGSLLEFRFKSDTGNIKSASMKLKKKRGLVPYTERLENNVIYIKPGQFAESAISDLRSSIQLDSLFNTVNRKGIILDVRNNLGGLLNKVIAVADLFVNKGVLIQVNEREQAIEKVYSASGDPFKKRVYAATDKPENDSFEDIPIVVLINEHTYSGAEALAFSLQSNNRATVIGGPSGKQSTVLTFYQPGSGYIYGFPTGEMVFSERDEEGQYYVNPDIMVESSSTEEEVLSIAIDVLKGQQ